MDILSSVSIQSLYSWDWGFSHILEGEQRTFSFWEFLCGLFPRLFNCRGVGCVFFFFLNFCEVLGFLVELGFHCLIGVFKQRGSPHISVNEWIRCTAIPSDLLQPTYKWLSGLSQTSTSAPIAFLYWEAQPGPGDPRCPHRSLFPALLFAFPVNTGYPCMSLCCFGVLAPAPVWCYSTPEALAVPEFHKASSTPCLQLVQSTSIVF